MKLWAVRNKHTKLYFPGYSSTRGSSFVEPTSKDRPRFHRTRFSASQTLAAWCRGYHIPLKDNEGYGLFTYGYKIRPVEGRKKEDFEIVEFNLIEAA